MSLIAPLTVREEAMLMTEPSHGDVTSSLIGLQPSYHSRSSGGVCKIVDSSIDTLHCFHSYNFIIYHRRLCVVQTFLALRVETLVFDKGISFTFVIQETEI